MILVDTSIWIDHFRKSDADLVRMLEHGQVLMHPFVFGELAMGSWRERTLKLESLQRLPAATAAHDREVLRFVDDLALHGLGIGYIDAHLLAATSLSNDALLWSRDKRLAEVATKLSIAYLP